MIRKRYMYMAHYSACKWAESAGEAWVQRSNKTHFILLTGSRIVVNKTRIHFTFQLPLRNGSYQISKIILQRTTCRSIKEQQSEVILERERLITSNNHDTHKLHGSNEKGRKVAPTAKSELIRFQRLWSKFPWRKRHPKL
jgi:hypothetical protein